MDTQKHVSRKQNVGSAGLNKQERRSGRPLSFRGRYDSQLKVVNSAGGDVCLGTGAAAAVFGRYEIAPCREREPRRAVCRQAAVNALPMAFGVLRGGIYVIGHALWQRYATLGDRQRPENACAKVQDLIRHPARRYLDLNTRRRASVLRSDDIAASR